jgi:hypothetical protein
LYPALPQAPLGENLAVNEYVETALPTVTGTVERDPVATSDKATLIVSFSHTSEKAKQLAIVTGNVPNAVLNSFQSFSGLIQDRMQRELDESADEHVISQIDAVTPSTGSTGTTTIEEIRHGVAEMRSVGTNPTLAAINPADAVLLDLTTAGADDLPIFSLRVTGDASPLFGLRFIEAKNVPEGSI